MMQKALLIVAIALVATTFAPNALADSFTYTFVGAPGPVDGSDYTLTSASGPLAYGTFYFAAPGSVVEWPDIGLTSPSDLVGVIIYPTGTPGGNSIEVFVATSSPTLTTGFMNFPTLTNLSVDGAYPTCGPEIGEATCASGNGGYLTISSTPTATPEPSTLGVLSSGLMGLGLIAVMKQRLLT
jgi:hypothetical protein